MVEYFLKDMGIALKEARQLGLSLPGLALANQLYLAVKVRPHPVFDSADTFLISHLLHRLKDM